MLKILTVRPDGVSVTRGSDEYFIRLDRPLQVDGQAGASAQRQGERRRDGRSWTIGAAGEQTVGAQLDRLASKGAVVLHDRAIPGSRANIDHIALGPTGVHVIDAKRYRGRVERRGQRLYVNGRDRGKLLESVARQARDVEAALGRADVPVHAALCFVGAEWGLFRRPLWFGDISVLWPGALDRLLWRDGPVGASTVQQLGELLKVALPPAV